MSLWPDNDKDHRAGMGDHPFLKATRFRLRVHRIVIRFVGSDLFLGYVFFR